MTAEWYYIGHYGQLGPLTREQIDELVEGGVIVRDTWIWRAGMNDWLPAEQVTDLAASFQKSSAGMSPPPAPSGPPMPLSRPGPAPRAAGNPPFDPLATGGYYPFPGVRSDKSKTLGGILQLILPGVGRIYLGYTAIGVLQLLLCLCGVGIMWGWIDGIVILAGGVRMDGYGRQLND